MNTLSPSQFPINSQYTTGLIARCTRSMNQVSPRRMSASAHQVNTAAQGE